MTKLALGIDTSNYTTSVAVVDENKNVLVDERIILDVKEGQKGLRQSVAFFQHVHNLPILLERVFKTVDKNAITSIGVSNKPRNVFDSYMPVFRAGESFADLLGNLLDAPVFKFSHQAGHIKAVEAFEKIKGSRFICFHISGGTTEILDILLNDKRDKILDIKIIGKTLDIAVGQLIDRIGVMLQYPFPAGKFMDQAAMEGKVNPDIKLAPIHMEGLDINLSGIETQLSEYLGKATREEIANALFTQINNCIEKALEEIKNGYGKVEIIFVGGVSQSTFIRKAFEKRVKFGKYSTDNAIGVALLGGINDNQTNKGKSTK